jgi:hypothetical protein
MALVPVKERNLRKNVCYWKNGPNYNSTECQLVRLTGNGEALAEYVPPITLSNKSVAPYLRAFIQGNNKFENQNLGRFNIMNNFFRQNPNLNKDQWFFQLVEMSAVLLPLVGTITAFTSLWIKDKLSAPFKQRYIDLINQDQRLLELINRTTGKNLKNINLRLLKDLAPLAQGQLRTNNLMMQRMNQVNEVNTRVQGMIQNAELRYNEIFAFIELFVKTSAYIAICVKMLLYMVMVTSDLKLQSVVSENDLHFLANVIARFIFILKKAGTLVSGALFKSLLKRFENSFGLPLVPKNAVEPIQGLIATALRSMTVDTFLIKLLSENIRDVDFMLNKLENNRGFLQNLAVIFLPFARKDIPLDAMTSAFRAARDYFVSMSSVVGVIMTVDAAMRGARLLTRRNQLRINAQ